jgi:DUF971 family protein
MSLVRLKRLSPAAIELAWSDGHVGPCSVRTLRDRCPCAGCSGETVLLRTFPGSPAPDDVPGKYELVRADVVGNYAVQLTWGDGHREGLYTWDVLRGLCECPSCVASRAGT